MKRIEDIEELVVLAQAAEAAGVKIENLQRLNPYGVDSEKARAIRSYAVALNPAVAAKWEREVSEGSESVELALLRAGRLELTAERHQRLLGSSASYAVEWQQRQQQEEKALLASMEAAAAASRERLAAHRVQQESPEHQALLLQQRQETARRLATESGWLG